MSSSNQSLSPQEENMNNYYDKLGQLEKISLTDSKLLELLKQTDIKKIHPLLSSYELMNSGDETTDWDNYQYKFIGCESKKQPLYFYNKNQPYYELTNFYRSEIVIDGELYPTVEHFYQSQKFPNIPKFQNKIKSMGRPSQAREIVYTPEFSKNFDNDWWSSVKDDVMLKGLRAKFTQNIALRNLLINTNSRVLIEDSPVDNYWGCGSEHNGLNKLGKLLMKVREEL